MGRSSVAVYVSTTSPEPPEQAFLDMSQQPGEHLLPLIGRVMAAAEISFSDLNRIAVSIGPGGFSSIRAGVAAARGLGLAASVDVVGISSFAIMATSFLTKRETPHDESTFGLSAPAGMDRFFCQALTADGLSMEPIEALLPHEALTFFDGRVQIVAGPGCKRLSEAGLRTPITSVDILPDAATLTRMATHLDPAIHKPDPLYVRSADARPQTGKSLGVDH